MKAPFEKFEIARAWSMSQWCFHIRILSSDVPEDVNASTENGFRDWETDARRFIETAIREKIERSVASSTNEGAAPGGGK